MVSLEFTGSCLENKISLQQVNFSKNLLTRSLASGGLPPVFSVDSRVQSSASHKIESRDPYRYIHAMPLNQLN